MLAAFLVMLREATEAALIVGIIASTLRQAGRADWMPLIWIGVASAALLSLGAGVALDLLGAGFPQRQQELFEAIVGLVAVGILTAMVFWMRKAARSIKGEIHGRIQAAIGAGTGAALIGMSFFAVLREGLEAVFFLLAIFQQSAGWGVPLGGLLGIAAAVAIGLAIYAGGARLDLARFFRWTGVFILLVAAGLAAGSLRALHEAGLWNGLQAVPVDLGAWLPVDGMAGALLAGLLGYTDHPTLGEILLWAGFLALTLPLFLRGARPAGMKLRAGQGA